MLDHQRRTIHVSRSVRPIRLAFLVRPDDKRNLERIFQINTCVWGGQYNGIVPVFGRTPKWWGQEPALLPKAREIAQGYVDAFEPDYVVTTHPGLRKQIQFDEQRILSLDDVFPVDDDPVATHSLSVISIYQELFNKQYRFVQKHKRPVISPVPVQKSERLFCAAVFGAFPTQEKYRYFGKAYNSAFEPEETIISPTNLRNLMTSDFLTPLKVGSAWLDANRRHWSLGPTLFMLDPNEPSDLVDYWNLRALGWNIFPVPRSWAMNTTDIWKEFVSKNHVPLRRNRNGVMHSTTLLKSRHIETAEFTAFAAAISIPGKAALVQQHWHPRIWDSWARDSDHVNRCQISHTQDDVECPVEDGQIIFSTLSPKFPLDRGISTKPRWANVTRLQEYGRASENAFIFPPGLTGLERLLKTSTEGTTFPTTEGVVSLVRYGKLKTYWHLPTGFSVFQSWLKQLGMKRGSVHRRRNSTASHPLSWWAKGRKIYRRFPKLSSYSIKWHMASSKPPLPPLATMRK